MRCRPWIWLWGLLPLALLWLAAIVAGLPKMERDLALRADMMLAGDGQNWARVALNGRDLTLSGAAPDEGARRRARETLSTLWGVRSVLDVTAVVAVPLQSAPAPSAETSDDGRPASRVPGAANTAVSE